MADRESTEPEQVAVSREQALTRLKKRRDFVNHLLVYTLVNGVLVAFWAITSLGEFFWPIFPMLGWGVAVVLNAWDVYRADTFSEEQIQREIEHLAGRR
jgi:2TM domain